MNTSIISATDETAMLLPVVPDALDQLLASLDGPQAVLMAQVLRERIDLYPTARATVFACSMRTIVQALEMRRDQHRASPFALDRTANLAQVAQVQAELWTEYATRYDVETDADISAMAGAKARADCLDELLQHMRKGDARPFMPAWADQVPPEDVEIDATCPECIGTGIGQHGDPETSRCATCRGKGVLTVTTEEI
jgi:hypothetical protein